MSELIAKSSGEIRARDAILGYLWYEKSEADKVIAELKEHNENYRFDNKNMLHKIMNQDAELHHHKYKRCLAMAERCKDKIDNPVERDEHDGWLIITEYWERWHKRWLELAEKFKEAK